MTKLDKPVTRETHAFVTDKSNERAVVVVLDRTTITLRLKGARSRGEVVLAVDKLFVEKEMAAARRAAGLN